MPSPEHERVIDFLVETCGAQRAGFCSALRDAVLCDRDLADPDFWEEEFRPYLSPLRPDAWRIDTDDLRVICWEIEVSHPISKLQADRYVIAADVLDYYEWDLDVRTINTRKLGVIQDDLDIDREELAIYLWQKAAA